MIAPPSTCVAQLLGHTLETVIEKRGYVVQQDKNTSCTRVSHFSLATLFEMDLET